MPQSPNVFCRKILARYGQFSSLLPKIFFADMPILLLQIQGVFRYIGAILKTPNSTFW